MPAAVRTPAPCVVSARQICHTTNCFPELGLHVRCLGPHPPPNSVRRLFVRLDGVVSLRGFEALLTWAPTAGESPAYQPSGYGAPVGTNCTWLLRGSPLTVANQTDSTLRLLSAGSVNSTCALGNVFVVNFPQHSPGQTPPGRIVLAFAVALDANYQEDILAVGAPATIKGGATEPAPMLSAFSPPAGWTGSETEYRIRGYQFHPYMSIRLAKGADTLSASEAVIPDSRTATARFTYSDSQAGWWNLILTNPGGRWTGELRSLKVTKEIPGGSGFSGSSGGGTVVLHVEAGKLPLTGPRAVRPSDLLGADVPLKNEIIASGAQLLRCLWPETRPHPRFAEQPDGSLEELFDFSRVFSLHFSDTTMARAAVSRLEQLESVISAALIPLGAAGGGFQICDQPGTPPCVSQPPVHPGDPNLRDETFDGERLQWYLTHSDDFYGNCNEDIQTTCAWNNDWARGRSSVILAMVDAGIDASHPDLAHTYQQVSLGLRILPGLNFAKHSDSDPIPPDEGDITDDFGHGTNVTGLAAAITDNGVSYLDEFGTSYGIAGVAGGWQSQHPDSVGVRILPLRVLNYANIFDGEIDGSGVTQTASAINYAANNGAKVINLSLGGYLSVYAGGDPAAEALKPLREAMHNAMLLGSTCVAAVGNEDHDGFDPAYPAVFARWGLCVAVGASDLFGRRAVIFPGLEASNRADFLDVIAPGHIIFTTQPTYVALNTDPETPDVVYSMRRFGTSFSCGLASGVAASLLSLTPQLRDVDIKQVLRNSAANPNGEFIPNTSIGYGRLDHDEAIRLVDPTLGRSVIGGNLTERDMVIDAGFEFLSIRGVAEDLGVPDGAYSAHKFHVIFSEVFPVEFVEETPLAWVNVVGTKGWLDNDLDGWDPSEHLFNYGSGVVNQVTSSGGIFYTTLYELPDLQAWVPCDTTEARIRYTAVGTPVGTVGVGAEPSLRSRLELSVRTNPVRQGTEIVMELRGHPGQKAHVEVFDVRGRAVDEQVVIADGDGMARIAWATHAQNTKIRAPGVYLVRARQRGDATSTRVVVLP